MSDFGYNNKAFNKRSLSNIMEEIEKQLREQEAFNDMVWNENEPFYQLNAVNAFFLSELWEVAEQVAYSSSPKFAEGNVLDAKCKIIGISRKRGNTSKGEVTIEGTEGTVVPGDFQITTNPENYVIFKVTKEGVIPKGGKLTLPIESLEKGTFTNVPEKAINNILTPVIGIKKVYNLKATKDGEYPETDMELRERYNASVSRTSSNIFDAILSNVLAVPGVKDAVIKVNDKMQEEEGIPPKAFHVIVNGGQDKLVAQAIFAKYPGGIQPYGNTVVQIADTQGFKHNIGFSRPKQIKVWIKCKITKNSKFAENGNELIKNAIENYINTIKTGKPVVLYKLIAAIDKEGIEGIEDITISLSKDGKVFKEENLKVDTLDVVTTSKENITVEVS